MKINAVINFRMCIERNTVRDTDFVHPPSAPPPLRPRPLSARPVFIIHYPCHFDRPCPPRRENQNPRCNVPSEFARLPTLPCNAHPYQRWKPLSGPRWARKLPPLCETYGGNRTLRKRCDTLKKASRRRRCERDWAALWTGFKAVPPPSKSSTNPHRHSRMPFPCLRARCTCQCV